MIPTFIFSILAFFIVTTTTIIVINNKSKVKHMNTVLEKTKRKHNVDNDVANKKMHNLVNEININNKKLEAHNNKVKKEIEYDTKKTKNALNNLDKRFNSYKNITTANFMGMNNRMTTENNRLQENIDIMNDKMKQHKRETIAKDSELNEKIANNQNTFDIFLNQNYNNTIRRLNARDDLNSKHYTDLASNMTSAMLTASNLDERTRMLIQQDIIRRDGAIKSSLTNFFNTSDDNFIATYYDKVGDSNIFKNWFDSYYGIGSNQNFQRMDELITLADENTNKIKRHTNRLHHVDSNITDIFGRLNSSSNLHKHELHSFIDTQYNFDLNNLSGIASNANRLSNINNELQSLRETLDTIGVFDLKNDSSITLEQLHKNIMSNQVLINSNNSRITNMFENQFGEYLGNNLEQYYVTISSNLDNDILQSKLAGIDMTVNSINTLDVDTNELSTNSLYIEGQDYKSKIDSNVGLYKSFEHIFDLNDVEARDHHIPYKDRTVHRDPLIKLKKHNKMSDEELINSVTGTKDIGNSVEFLPGTDLFLSRDKLNNENDKLVGGKIFVDSFYDIGLNTKDSFDRVKNQTDNLNRQAFKDDVSLGSTLSNMDTRINQMVTDIKTVSKTGITKSQLYNILNDEDPSSVEPSYNNNRFERPYQDAKANSIRIENLYTGKPSNGECTNNDGQLNDTYSQCKTIDDRLKELEEIPSDIDTAVSTQVGNIMNTLYGTTYTTDNSSNVLDRSLHVQNNLKVNQDVNVMGRLDVKGDMHIGGTNSDLILKNIEDLKYADNTGDNITNRPILNQYLKKNSSSDPYIKDVQHNTTNNTYTFTKSDGSTESINMSTPDSLQIRTGDTKQIRKKSSDELISFTGNPAFSTGDIDEYEITKYGDSTLNEDVIVPTKYVYSVKRNDSTNNLDVVEVTTDNRQAQSSSIDLGVNRDTIIDHLENRPSGDSSQPHFQGIKLGDGCLKIEDYDGRSTLKLCGSECTGCTPIWDYNAAPEPVYASAPTMSS